MTKKNLFCGFFPSLPLVKEVYITILIFKKDLFTSNNKARTEQTMNTKAKHIQAQNEQDNCFSLMMNNRIRHLCDVCWFYSDQSWGSAEGRVRPQDMQSDSPAVGILLLHHDRNNEL